MSDEPGQQVISNSKVTYHFSHRLMKRFGAEGSYF